MIEKIQNKFPIYLNRGFSKVKRLFQIRESMVILLTLLFIIVMRFLTPNFFTFNNFKAIGIAVAMETPVVIGMGILLITGCFDLSVGSVSALASMVAGISMIKGNNIILSIIMGLIAGLLIGIFNGVMVTRLKINALIATLATMTIARGITLLIGGGKIQYGFPEAFAFLGRGKIFNIYFCIWLALIMVIIGDLCLRKIRAFRQIYYIGGNEMAAIYAGIKVDRVRMVAFSLCSLLASVNGIMVSSRVLAATPVINVDLPLRVIAAAIIGGCTIRGGEGSVVGSFMGIVFMFLIYNAMVLLRISVFWQGIVIGLVLASAVAIDSLRKMKR